MPTEYAVIILAVAALITGGLYLMTRRRRKKKSAPPVRPAAPTNQTAGVAATWAPPVPARPALPPQRQSSLRRPYRPLRHGIRPRPLPGMRPPRRQPRPRLRLRL